MFDIYSSPAVQYAEWCLWPDNEKVPQYVKLQCEQWLKILRGEDDEAYVDGIAYQRICKLLKLIMHPDLGVSMYEGMEDYAWLLIVATLCTKCKEDGTRYYETALLEIARKNFKTFNSAVIFIVLMLTENRFSRYFSVAPDLKLSKELQVAIRKIIKSSPYLDDNVFKTLRSEIRCKLTDSEYVPLAYSQDKMDGKLAHAFLADEAGAMDGYPIEAMRSSQITLVNKLGIIISTQYPNDDNAMIDEIDISKKTLDGLIDDRRRFSLLYEPDQKYLVDDQWMEDDNIIFQANPVAVKNKSIFNAIKKIRTAAKLYENKRENFLCKHLNIKYKGLGVEGYIDISAVKSCSDRIDKTFWKGKKVYVGLDLSQTDDNTAVAMATEVNGEIYALVHGFIPADRKDLKSQKEGVDYDRLVRSGVCTACGDAVIDYSVVEQYILDIERIYGCEIVQCGYDRWNAISTVQKLEESGIECTEIRQHSSVLHSPTKLLKEKILSKKCHLSENQMLEINFENARCTEDTNKNKYVNKKKSEGKVDMVVALINAMYLVEQNMLYGYDFIALT